MYIYLCSYIHSLTRVGLLSALGLVSRPVLLLALARAVVRTAGTANASTSVVKAASAVAAPTNPPCAPSSALQTAQPEPKHFAVFVDPQPPQPSLHRAKASAASSNTVAAKGPRAALLTRPQQQETRRKGNTFSNMSARLDQASKISLQSWLNLQGVGPTLKVGCWRTLYPRKQYAVGAVSLLMALTTSRSVQRRRVLRGGTASWRTGGHALRQARRRRRMAGLGAGHDGGIPPTERPQEGSGVRRLWPPREPQGVRAVPSTGPGKAEEGSRDLRGTVSVCELWRGRRTLATHGIAFRAQGTAFAAPGLPQGGVRASHGANSRRSRPAQAALCYVLAPCEPPAGDNRREWYRL